MKFVYPEFLWAFGVLIIPIIIHLFNFRKYKILYFSSLKFIQLVDQQTRSTQKLKHLLVLISRILLFSCLVLAFAQPYIPVSLKSSKGGKPVLAIYIDNSFSMSMKGTEGELISEAREMARNMINEASLDTRFMLVTNEMSGIEQHLVSKPDALERLDKIEICPLVRSIPEVINWEKATIQREHETNQKIGSQQFVILSDFQKNSSDFSKLILDKESFYYPVKLSPQEVSNLFIDSVWFSSPIQKTNETNELNIRVQNFGENDLTNVELKLEIGSIKRDIFIDVKANSKANTTIVYTEGKEGIKKGKVSVNDKQFFYDDDYFFSYSVSKNSEILIVNGENFVKNSGLVYSLDNYYKITEVEQNSFNNDYLKNKDLVIINGAKEIPSGLAEELVSYTENGGSLALFPGEDISPSESGWNAFLSLIKMPTLGNVFTEGVKIKKLNFDDSFFKSVFEKNPKNINLPTIAKAYHSTNTLKTKSVDLIELQNGNPLYIRSLGELNVFLFTSSLSSSYGSFVNNALFSTIMLRTAEMSQRRVPIALIIGEDTKFPVYTSSKSESPIRLKSKTIDFIPTVLKKGTVSYILLNGLGALETLKAGTFDIVKEVKNGAISLNYNRKESDITSYLPSEIDALFKNQGIEHVRFSEISEGQSLTHIDLEKPYEYWKLFILLGLLFVLIEMTLLKFWKK